MLGGALDDGDYLFGFGSHVLAAVVDGLRATMYNGHWSVKCKRSDIMTLIAVLPLSLCKLQMVTVSSARTPEVLANSYLACGAATGEQLAVAASEKLYLMDMMVNAGIPFLYENFQFEVGHYMSPNRRYKDLCMPSTWVHLGFPCAVHEHGPFPLRCGLQWLQSQGFCALSAHIATSNVHAGRFALCKDGHMIGAVSSEQGDVTVFNGHWSYPLTWSEFAQVVRYSRFRCVLQVCPSAVLAHPRVRSEVPHQGDSAARDLIGGLSRRPAARAPASGTMRRPAASSTTQNGYVAKRGKARQHTRPMRRPASASPMKSSWEEYNSIPYVREPAAQRQKLRDQTWSTELGDFLNMDYYPVARKLLDVKLVKDYSGQKCPYCGTGNLGKFRRVFTDAQSQQTHSTKCSSVGTGPFLSTSRQLAFSTPSSVRSRTIL